VDDRQKQIRELKAQARAIPKVAGFVQPAATALFRQARELEAEAQQVADAERNIAELNSTAAALRLERKKAKELADEVETLKKRLEAARQLFERQRRQAKSVAK
jgi:hypothetical protein